MTSYKILKLIKKAEEFEESSNPLKSQNNPFSEILDNEEETILYRCQPIGKSLTGHISGLGTEKVNGIFAFEDPAMLFQTYSWIHMRKNIDNYEMITFLGKIIDRPADSEGVVVVPTKVLSKTPLKTLVQQMGVPLTRAAFEKIVRNFFKYNSVF